MKAATYEMDLRPYFEEAVEKFGLVKLEYIDWMIENAHTPDGLGNDADTIRYKNKHSWRDCLTERGLKDPEQSFDDTFWYAIGKARRDAYKERNLRSMACKYNFAGIRTLAPMPRGYCEVGERMAGRVLSSHPELPYPGCQQRVCRCSWQMVYSSDAEKAEFKNYLDCRDTDFVKQYEEERRQIEKNRERLKELGVEINVTIKTKRDE